MTEAETKKPYNKVPFTVAFGEAVNLLPGALPETIKNDLLHFTLMNAQLMISKRIFYKRWAIEKATGRFKDDINMADVTPITSEEEKKLMDLSKADYRKVCAIRNMLQTYFDIDVNPYFEDGLINELEDDFAQMSATKYDEFNVNECISRYNNVQAQMAKLARESGEFQVRKMEEHHRRTHPEDYVEKLEEGN